MRDCIGRRPFPRPTHGRKGAEIDAEAAHSGEMAGWVRGVWAALQKTGVDVALWEWQPLGNEQHRLKSLRLHCDEANAEWIRVFAHNWDDRPNWRDVGKCVGLLSDALLHALEPDAGGPERSAVEPIGSPPAEQPATTESLGGQRYRIGGNLPVVVTQAEDDVFKAFLSANGALNKPQLTGPLGEDALTRTVSVAARPVAGSSRRTGGLAASR